MYFIMLFLYMNQIYIYILITIIVYFIFSFSEYLIHRFIMHDNSTIFGKEHLIHHKSTNNETMQIIESSELDHRQNLCFDYDTLIITIVLFALYLFILRKFTKKKEYIIYSFLLFVFLSLFIVTIWNSIHCYMHNEDSSKKCKIYLSNDSIEKIKDTIYVKWIIWNHTLHHIRKGERKGNFNIVLPGADHLFGTYYTTP